MSVVGLDIGGTSVRMVVVARDGTLVGQDRLATSAERGVQDTLQRIIRCAEELVARLSAGPVEAVGIGVTGPVDVTTGILSNPFTLPGWPPTNLRDAFADAFGATAVVDNDANVAAVGEGWLGAGRGARRMTMVTIGTGIGVAMLTDGRIQRTSGGQHGEAGHMVLNPFGPTCYCGARGCWEALASGTALDRCAQDLADDPESLIGQWAQARSKPADGELLFEAAAAGDRLAADAVDAVARWWGLGLVNLAATTMPDVIVLSGGAMNHFERVRPTILEVMWQHSAMIPTALPIEAASLGELAGAMGAAKLALDLPSPPPQAVP